MRVAEIERRELLSWPTERGEPAPNRWRRIDSFLELELSTAELTVVCEEGESPRPLPPLIITRTGGARDLVAWANTYMSLRPLTAFTRVIPKDELWMLEIWPRNGKPRFNDVAVLGPIITEAAVESESRLKPTLQSLQATFSYAAARATMFGLLNVEPHILRERWMAVHAPSGARRIGVRDVDSVWQRIARAIEPRQVSLFTRGADDLMDSVIKQLIARVPIPTGLWSRLAGIEITSDARHTAEERLTEFANAHARLRGMTLPADVISFVLGYMVNRIAPGSFSHINLARRADVGSAAIAWYGFLAAVDPASKIHLGGNGLAWRLYRDLASCADLRLPTVADIGFAEYEMVRDNEALRDAILGGVRSFAVELLPGIYSHVAVQGRMMEDVRSSHPPLQELGISLARAMDAYRKLSQGVEVERPNRPRSERRKKQ